MKTIWKFTTDILDETVLQMPQGAKILHVDKEVVVVGDRSYSRILLWAHVDLKASLVIRKFSIRGTGHPLGEVGPYVGTVIDGPFVWHLFEGV